VSTHGSNESLEEAAEGINRGAEPEACGEEGLDGREAVAEPPGSGRRRGRQEARRVARRRRPPGDGAGRLPPHAAPPLPRLRRPLGQRLLPLVLPVYARRRPQRRRRRPRRHAAKKKTRSCNSEERLCTNHIISVPGQASGRIALRSIRRILVPEPLQIEPLPEAIPVPALPLPRAEAAQVRGLPQEVRAGDQALPARRQAAQVRSQRRPLRVQVRGVVPLQRPRQPHAHHRLHLPVRAAHRPGAPHPRRAGAGGPLLRAVPGQLVGAPGGLPGEQPAQAPHRRAGELRQHAQERRRPQRRRPQRRAGVVAAALRVPPRRAVPASSPTTSSATRTRWCSASSTGCYSSPTATSRRRCS